MSKLKINEVEYGNIQSNVEKSYETIVDTVGIYDQEFANLYYSIVTSGFLEKLYEDAKSNYYILRSAGNIAGNMAMGALMGTSIGKHWIGTIVGAAAGLIYGLIKELSDPSSKWKDDAKKNFENLLDRCNNGDDDSYIRLYNMYTKVKNTRTSLVEILTKINEFNMAHANMSKAFEQQGLKTSVAQDGITLTGVNTSVNIGGQQVEMSLSEAMNAFYTYETTIMESELQAEYLNKTYGYEFDYTKLVENTNAFTSQAISSGLYTHEFIEAILPNKTVSSESATSQIASDTGISIENINDTINAVGGTGSVLGLQVLGKTSGQSSDTKKSKDNDKDKDKDKDKEKSKSTGKSSKNTSKNSSSKSSSKSSSGSKSSSKTSSKVIVEKTGDQKTAVPSTNAEVAENTTSTASDVATMNTDPEKQSEQMLEESNAAVSTNPTMPGNDNTSEDDIDSKNYKLDIINELWDNGKKDEIKAVLIKIGYTEEEAKEILSDRAKLNNAILNGKKNDIATLDPSRDDGEINGLNLGHDYSSSNTVDNNNAMNSIENINNINLNTGFIRDNDDDDDDSDNRITGAVQSRVSSLSQAASSLSTAENDINLDNFDITIMS